MDILKKTLVILLMLSFCIGTANAQKQYERKKDTDSKAIRMKGIWYNGDTVEVTTTILLPALRNVQKSELEENGLLKLSGSDYKSRTVEGVGCKIVKHNMIKGTGGHLKEVDKLYAKTDPNAKEFILIVKAADTLQANITVDIRPTVRFGITVGKTPYLLDTVKPFTIPRANTNEEIRIFVVDKNNKKMKVTRHILYPMSMFRSMGNTINQNIISTSYTIGDKLNSRDKMLLTQSGEENGFYLLIDFEDELKRWWEIDTAWRKTDKTISIKIGKYE